jgi:N-acetylneuraminic acid mutarotase
MRYTLLLFAAAVLVAACSSEPGDGGGDAVDDASADAAAEDVSADAEPDVEHQDADEVDADVAGTWSDIAPLELGPRQETAVVALEGRVFVIGGYTDTGSLVNTVEAYDPSADTWTEVASVPARLHHANAAVVDSKIYILGFLTRGFAPSGRCFVYDPAEDAWTEISSMPSGAERGSSAIAEIDGEVYVAGGLQNGAVNMVSKFDPQTEEWTELASAPRSFDHAAYGAIDGKLVVAGGRDTNIGAITADVDIYDPASDTWSSGAQMPTARGGVAGAVLDGELYVIGGEGNSEVATGVFDDVEAYDPATDTWTILETMPNPRHGMGAAAVDGRVIVPGGADEEAFAAVATSTSLSP